jgi:glycosyltransferase involved in cell wall biosynthesis
MRVALDAEPLTLTSGGLKRYVEELTRALRAQYPQDAYLYLPEPKNFLERRWWLYGAERASSQARVDVFHGTNFSIPFFSRRPAVLTLHDLSPWRDRHWHSSKSAARIRRRTPYLLPRASHIITPSEAVRGEAIRRFGVSPERITAIPLAASGHFRPVPQPSSPYFLFVGTLEPRKGLQTLLEAWRATGKTIPLRIAGRLRADFPPLVPEHNLELMGEVPDSALPPLYTNANAVIYPSEYEGFGLPVLEAMQCGANVITSCDPALMELTGDAAQHVSSAQELHAALTFDADSSARRGAAIARAAQYSWKLTAQRTHAVYERVAR